MNELSVKWAVKEAVKVVAFDCDGVMFDSAAANQAYYNQVLRQFDLPEMTPAQFGYVHMHTVHEALAFLLRDPERIAAAETYRRQMDPMTFIRLMTIEPHLRAVLDRLRPTVKTAIATNRVDTMRRVLREHGLSNGFDLVVTAADVTHPKPHPEQLLKIIGHFGIAAAQMLYIGDSALDAAAAQAAEVPFVAYRNPDLEALAHIDGLDQLVALLRRPFHS